MSENQRSLGFKCWLLRSANHVKITEPSVMCTERNVLVKNCLQIG